MLYLIMNGWNTRHSLTNGELAWHPPTWCRRVRLRTFGAGNITNLSTKCIEKNLNCRLFTCIHSNEFLTKNFGWFKCINLLQNFVVCIEEHFQFIRTHWWLSYNSSCQQSPYVQFVRSFLLIFQSNYLAVVHLIKMAYDYVK